MATLQVDTANGPKSFDLNGADEFTIGRHPTNSIQLTAATVSGRHAVIRFDGTAYSIEDVGSRNGTVVNEVRISDAVPLGDQAAIMFGDCTARFIDKNSIRETQDADDLSPVAFKQTLQAGDGPQQAAQLPQMIAGTSPFGIEITNEFEEASISNSIEMSSRYGMLESKPEAKLKAVLEISNSLAGNIDLESMLPKILDTLFNIFKLADRGCILLKDEKGELVPRAIKHRSANRDESVRLSRTILDRVMKEKRAIRSADAANEWSESESIADLRIRSMMCVPIVSLDGEPVGVISIDSQNPLGQFSDEELDILVALAGQAGLQYESTRLMQSYLEKQKQDSEMKIAEGVQRALLPETLPSVEGYEFFASYDAAQAVGGDYYDVIELPDGKICISFGDVAGKGVPGALIMSRFHSCVRSTLAHVDDVEKAINAINENMCHHSAEGRFVTYVLAILDPKTHEVVLSNAGHMSPLVRNAQSEISSFDDELVGPPIGVMDGYPYEVESRKLEPGDIVLIVTDGVDEAMNNAEELYGKERIIEFLKSGPTNGAELGKQLLMDVRKHADGRPQNDDITIFCFGRNK